jgi:hypothetical protein
MTYKMKNKRKICEKIFLQLQPMDLTHMFCFWIPCHKIYIKGSFSYVLTLKYTCHLGWGQKKLTLKTNHKIK